MSEVQETVPYKLWRIRLESSLKFRGNGEFYGEFFRWGGSGEGKSHATMVTYPADRDEIAMAHTTPIQEKLSVDDSLIIRSRDPRRNPRRSSGNATRGEFDILPFSFWSSS